MTHMITQRITWAIIGVVVAGNGCLAAEQTEPGSAPAAPVTSQTAALEAQRQQVLTSERWRQARRAFDEWLSVQRLYSPAEVAMMKAELRSRVDNSTPGELQDLLEDMESRLVVLNSDEAWQARAWLEQFLSRARNAEEQVREKRPDVMNMSASQIRQELDRFQQRRGAQQQSQAAFDRGRQIQMQSVQSRKTSQKQAQTQVQDARSRAAQTNQSNFMRSRYTPATQLPGFSDPANRPGPVYQVGPWGSPYGWHPMGGGW